MYFRKYPYAANFDFMQNGARIGATPVSMDVRSYEGDVHRITCRSRLWDGNCSQAELSAPRARRANAGAHATSLDVGKGFALTLRDARGRVLLSAPGGRSFGLCGKSSMFRFDHQPDHQYYGMGEKCLGLELSGVTTKFWNTDLLADFNFQEIREGRPDPMYLAIPYVIVKRGNTFVGLLLDNPQAAFVSTAAETRIEGELKVVETPWKCVTIGAEDGQPDLWIIVGPSLRELTMKLQKLVGVTPLPPAWALGYNQCRWGYKSAADLEWLDGEFRKHGIPCDGLWLDIDYMDAFKVFTFNKQNFPALKRTLKELKARGRRVVPIIDPGVKQLPGYPVYDDGRKARAFCLNPQGREFVGLVWPGETVFPDFSTDRGRRWWAKHVKQFAELGIEGAWIDMNDPSTGVSDPSAMLFNDGLAAHDTFHNQYALGMARATRDGFRQARPRQRPFLVSRSGSIGIGKYTAVWTGDNVSNYHHLRNAIPVSLNLALSGVPFNGPDVGGFALDTTPELIVDWQKACFLFPFCRNHTVIHTRRQEPWAFGDKVMRILRHYIRLRYKFRPYLYNLFIRQEESGDAILRPLFYDFADSRAMPLGKVDDQFMVGPAVMQAPVLTENTAARDVLLPGKTSWYSALDGAWVAGGRKIRVRVGRDRTALYFRENSIVPLAPGEPQDNRFDGTEVELHIFLRRTSKAAAETEYVFDDGLTYDYREGKRSRLAVRARVRGGELRIRTKLIEDGYGRPSVTFVLYDQFRCVTVDGRRVEARSSSWRLAGVRQDVRAIGPSRGTASRH